MSTSSRTHATPSDDDMHAAWQQLRRRDWPSLPEIKRAAALYQLVRGAALRKAQGLPPEPQAALPTDAAQPSPAVQTPAPTRQAHASHPPRQPPLFDHKRAAAGEREDD